MENKTVKNLGEAISVLVQVANLAQSRGILSLEDAVIVKSAMDFIDTINQNQPEEEAVLEGPKG
jgi:hypothetical protein